MMILDASFIVKLFVEEPGSELAENHLDELLRSGGGDHDSRYSAR